MLHNEDRCEKPKKQQCIVNGSIFCMWNKTLNKSALNIVYLYEERHITDLCCKRNYALMKNLKLILKLQEGMQLILVNLQGKNATKASKVLVFAPDNKTRYSIAALVKRRYVKKKHTQRIHKINQDPCEGTYRDEHGTRSLA